LGCDLSALAAAPVPASEIGLTYLDDLNRAYDKFRAEMAEAEKHQDSKRAYFLQRLNSDPSFTQSITSFLCTDAALDIFKRGAEQFRNMALKHAEEKFPNEKDIWSNQECLNEARRFFDYADVEGFRGSPHKL
jgi:DNA modification methylase